MDFTQNYFDLLGLPQEYVVDKKILSNNYRELQKKFHPDNFSTQSATEKRQAVQFSAYINTAYQTLLSLVLRAEYLLSLAGKIIDHQTVTINDGDFLMMQMEWREALADIKNDASDMSSLNSEAEASLASQLDSLQEIVKKESSQLQTVFTEYYREQSYDAAVAIVAKLHFTEKMQREIESVESTIMDQ